MVVIIIEAGQATFTFVKKVEEKDMKLVACI
jgi:hypothetical protein